MIKLLIVDDSALMRRQLMTVFQAEGDFDIRQARNGAEALLENREFQPDVVTLDINMPEIDGLTALSMIMVERPVPVVMVSSLTEKGALATFEALNLGAVDFVAKPGGTISLSIGAITAELVSKVRGAARAQLRTRVRANLGFNPGVRSAERASVAGLNRGSVAVAELGGRGVRDLAGPRPAAILSSRFPRHEETSHSVGERTGARVGGLLLIGASTGGPRALEIVLSELPASFPWPVLVAQHMPAAFTRPFAERLDQICSLKVQEASHPMAVDPGNVYIGKGSADMVVTRRNGQLTVLPAPESPQHLWHPSVELLGRSVLQHCDPAGVTAVMLTGMGYDGSDAFTEIKKRGGRTIAESEESAVVFGMPGELKNKGGASLVLAVEKIPGQINSWVRS